MNLGRSEGEAGGHNSVHKLDLFSDALFVHFCVITGTDL